VPAVLTTRRELQRALNVEEAAELPKLLAGLLQTNIALQRHAQLVAKFVAEWSS
jgi:hypothetical protein